MDVTVVAAGAPAWAGMTAGIVAAALFVLFAAWIVVERVRRGRHANDAQDRGERE